MPRAWSFARVSSQQQADQGGGLQRQSDSALAVSWCERHGYELTDRLAFTGSAYKGHHLADGAPLRAWLDQAAAGLLGEAPTLLVEEIDRFTRQAAHHALAELLHSAFPAGVVIVSLRDGTVYSQQAFEADDRLLGDLLEEIRSAHRYSKRLSRRLGSYWQQVRDQIAAGQVVRPDSLAPFWISATANGWEFNEQEALARRIFARALDVGSSKIARELNRDGVPALTRRGPATRPWTAAGLMSHLRNPAAYGTARTRKGKAGQEERDGYFPALITRAEWDRVQASIEARKRDTSTRGSLQACRWIGQRLTRCSCGAAMGVVSSGRRGDRITLHRYLCCSRRRNQLGACQARGYRLDLVTAHLLTRLQPGQLAHLTGASGDRQATTRAAVERHRAAEARARAAEAEARSAATALKGAIRGGRSVDVFVEAHQEAEVDATAARAELADAAAELRRLVDAPEAAALEEPAAELLAAFSRGDDTPEQRRAVQAGLRRLGVQITMAADRQAMGLAIGSGPEDWQPVSPLQLEALHAGQAGILSLDLGDAVAVVAGGWVTVGPLDVE